MVMRLQQRRVELDLQPTIANDGRLLSVNKLIW